MITDSPKGKGGNKDLLSNSESESFKIKINEGKKIERNKYICAEKDCNLIPKIINVHSETGIIVMQCHNNHLKEIDVEEYLKIIDEKSQIEPKENIKVGENYEYDTFKKGTIISNEEKSDVNIIEEKSKDISNIIRAFNQLLLAQENQPDNYLHNRNLLNLGKFIESENSRSFDDKNNLKDYIKKSISNNQNILDNKYETKFDNIFKKLEEEKDQEKAALENLVNEFGINLEDCYQEKDLELKLKGPKNEGKYKKLGNKGFEYISQIRFKNLIELNLANNNITEISYLNNMLLPHLEVLNLSNNEITDIEPVAKLLSKNLRIIYLQYNKITDLVPVANLISQNLHVIYLQYNQIEDIKPLLKPKFSIESLKMFRIDNNKVDIKKLDFQKLIEKYKKKIIYEDKNWNDFNEKYKCYLDNDETKLDLSSRRKSELVIDLFPLIAYPNNIKMLILDNNRIQDVSLMADMPLYYLEYLDLSLNLISSIIFIKKLSIKCQKLKILYLHDNKINDITPLCNYKYDEKNEKGNKEGNVICFENLETLTLKNNSLNFKDKATKEILKSIANNKNLIIDYKEEIDKLLESDKDEELKEKKKHTGEKGAADHYNNNTLNGPELAYILY